MVTNLLSISYLFTLEKIHCFTLELAIVIKSSQISVVLVGCMSGQVYTISILSITLLYSGMEASINIRYYCYYAIDLT